MIYAFIKSHEGKWAGPDDVPGNGSVAQQLLCMEKESRVKCNRRNGKTKKQVQTSAGEISVETPRDGYASFDSQLEKKSERVLSEGVVDCIVVLYAFGNSVRQISDWMYGNLGNRMSAENMAII